MSSLLAVWGGDLCQCQQTSGAPADAPAADKFQCRGTHGATCTVWPRHTGDLGLLSFFHQHVLVNISFAPQRVYLVYLCLLLAACCSVVLLHHKLAPGSLAADAAERTNYFVQAAVTLATQQQQDLRHVAVIVPDVGDRLLGTGQPQSPALSGADPTAAAAAPRGAASVPGRSGSRGSLQAAAMAQAGAQDASILREIACMKLDLASQQPRLLSGTFGQLLQLLTALLGSSSDQRAGTEATGTS